MKGELYKKTWFKNIIMIGIPTIISIIGMVVSIIENSTIKVVMCIASFFLLIGFGIFIIYDGKQGDTIKEKLDMLEKEKQDMKIIINHLELENKFEMQTINTISRFAEKWAKNINEFANEVERTGSAFVKYWDKIRLYDSICVQCRDAIETYVGKLDHTKVSVGFIEYFMDENQEEFANFIAHSNSESTRPRACEKKEKLVDCKYRYAQLMRERNSDIEVASNNEEIMRLFKPVSVGNDLKKYTQYIAIPVFCSRKKMLGVFQIVTKHDYIIIDDKVNLKSFAESSLVPFSNLIILVDKISKGLYAKPMKDEEKINGEK